MISSLTPLNKAANKHGFIKDNWMRFNSLPDEVQTEVINLIWASNGSGWRAVKAQVSLKHLVSMDDSAIIESYESYIKEKNGE